MAATHRCAKCGSPLGQEILSGACPSCTARGALAQLEVEAQLPEQVGDTLGRYKLREMIGKGGQGLVFLADQEEPVRRSVALKVIKPGMDTTRVIARFEAERQALAMLDHPNIARVIDAGATQTGRPYFVMELVDGTELTEYCDDHNLSTRLRIDLFLQICHGVQHAHQKGIIHRDLKPANVLVTQANGAPVPKVIDFGVAKAIQQQLTDETLSTAGDQVCGSIGYMSPEQAGLDGMGIDTRSDVYSLGVVLYELLTGHLPFEKQQLVQGGLEGMRKVLRDNDPPKPSTRFITLLEAARSEAAKHRDVNPPKLMSLLRGDLDLIVMRCLEKDRERRYASVDALAADLDRHLHNEPVEAVTPSLLYRARKFTRRYRPFITTGAVIMVIMIGGIATSLLEAARAKRAERETGTIAGFLEEMLDRVRPEVALGRDTKLLREILDWTAARVDTELTDQPKVQANLRNTIARVLIEVGDYDKAEIMYQQVLAAKERLLGSFHPFHPETADCLINLGVVRSHQGRLKDAEEMFDQALRIRERRAGNERQTFAALNNRAANNFAQERYAEAQRTLLEALAVQKRSAGAQAQELATLRNNLASTLMVQGKLAAADSMLREALAIQKGFQTNESPASAMFLSNLARVLREEGKLEEAEPAFRQALAAQKRFHGEKHEYVAATLDGLGLVFLDRGKPRAAEAAFREALAIQQELQQGSRPDVVMSFKGLGDALREQFKLPEAATALHEAFALARKLWGEQHPNTCRVLNSQARLLQDQGKLQEAQSMFSEILARLGKSPGNNQLDIGRVLVNLGAVLVAQQKLTEAEPKFREALALFIQRLGNDHPATLDARNRLSDLLKKQVSFAPTQ